MCIYMEVTHIYGRYTYMYMYDSGGGVNPSDFRIGLVMAGNM